MTDVEFVEFIRNVQNKGTKGTRWRCSEILGELVTKYRGCRYIRLSVDGSRNGNPHDIWIESRSGRKILGRAYLGSKQGKQNLEGWPERIAMLKVKNK